MKRLLIIGAGGFGREVLRWAQAVPEDKRDWYILGFLDDNLKALANYDTGVSIIGSIPAYVPEANDVFLCAIADPQTKLKICEAYVKKGAEFINLIHPTAGIASTCRIGKGIILCPYSGCSDSSSLEDFVTLNCFSGIAHDAVVEKGCTLSSYCDVTGFTHLEEGVFLGSHAVVIPGIRVGRYSRVGAGSVVIRNVPPGVTVFGNPAKIISQGT